MLSATVTAHTAKAIVPRMVEEGRICAGFRNGHASAFRDCGRDQGVTVNSVATRQVSKKSKAQHLFLAHHSCAVPGLLLLFSFEGSRLHLFLLSRSYRD